MHNAGSEAAFRIVDLDLIVKIATFALSAGAERFIMVSSVGASPAAKNFYLRVKGEAEKAVEQLRFRSLLIMQPSMLLGARRELRTLELVAQPMMRVAGPLLIGKWSRFRAIDAGDVATAMYGATRNMRKGVYRYSYAEIRKLVVDSNS